MNASAQEGYEVEAFNKVASSRRTVEFSVDKLVELIPQSDVDVDVDMVVSDVDESACNSNCHSSSDFTKIVQRKNRRTSLVTDLATGRKGGAREQMAQVRSTSWQPTGHQTVDSSNAHVCMFAFSCGQLLRCPYHLQLDIARK
jgi:hypothetical protein